MVRWLIALKLVDAVEKPTESFKGHLIPGHTDNFLSLGEASVQIGNYKNLQPLTKSRDILNIRPPSIFILFDFQAWESRIYEIYPCVQLY